MVYCNNENCQHYEDDQTCNAIEVFYVDRLCVTFKRKPREDNYKQMMRADSYRRERGAIKQARVTDHADEN